MPHDELANLLLGILPVDALCEATLNNDIRTKITDLVVNDGDFLNASSSATNKVLLKAALTRKPEQRQEFFGMIK